MKVQEYYLPMRMQGKTNQEIADAFGVKKSTIDRAIGSDKKFKEEKKMGINARITQPRVEKKAKREAPVTEVTQTDQPAQGEVLKTKVVNCCDCGKTFSIHPAEQKFYMSKGYDLPKRCEECRTKRKKVEKRICVDCGVEFEIKRTQREYFEKHGIQLPKRCPDCIQYKKEHNAKMEAKAKAEAEAENQ